MANKTLKKTGKKKTSSSGFGRDVFKSWQPVATFGFSLLIFFLVIVPGENLWLWLHNFIFSLFGVCSILWPILIGTVAVLDAMGKSGSNVKLKLWLSVATIIFACSIFYVFSCPENSQNTSNVLADMLDRYRAGEFNGSSGLFGALIGVPCVWAFGIIGARITNIILLFVCLMFLTSATLMDFFGLFSKPAKAIKQKIEDRNIEREARKTALIDIDLGEKRKEKSKKVQDAEIFENGEKETDEISKVTEKFLSKIKNENVQKEEAKTQKPEEKSKEFEVPENKNIGAESYEYPSVDLLNDAKKPDGGDITSELNHNGKMLVDTLKSFNVNTKIIDISRGPAVTRYELQPAAGVKISKITTLADDIALNLAASGVRIEAPIPGKAAVGIEIPNKVVSMVSMKELIVSPEFKRAKSKLTVVLGRDISGDIMTADLAKMPHLLIAGSTGSGKSVCINSFIISILYNARPDEVKLLMVDPKVVELGVYNGIPHLLVPVVTDPRKAAGALNWAVNEMLVRYKKFAETGVRDLTSYNQMVAENPDAKDKSGEPLEKMPQIVIIIDELSDLMMAAPNEVEDYICRLAQMARAAGMHLVIATQRPSVDVITGIIKANIPSRIALAVSSQIDSRTILDMSGAEKLLGRGDMLFAPVGCNKPIRVQGCYVTDREIEKVVNSIKMTEESNYDEEIAKEIEKGAVLDSNAKSDVKTEGTVDPMMAEAVKCVVEAGQASTSLLQRRLRVGYARAGRLVDEMEQMGIVGPHEGSKPRQVLITYQQFLEMNLNNAE
ncbi:MAG: DNA translocase FtsK [Clostridia bacterium]|nr:DNA translocase FtsK [Clostridia bacterium]